MPVTKFKVGKKEYVIIPRRRYEKLTRLEEDDRDAANAAKAMEDYESGKLKLIPLEEARKRWGL